MDIIQRATVEGEVDLENELSVGGNIQTQNPLRVGGNINVGGNVKLPIDYEDDKQLINRPQINDIELIGNKTSEQLYLQGKMNALTVQEVQSILYNNEKRRRKV